MSTRLTEDGWIRISVVDNGTGIAPQKLDEIFKPFVSTKGSKGTGLGLAVSRKILHEHGGDIEVQSQVGVGSNSLWCPDQEPAAQRYGGDGERYADIAAGAGLRARFFHGRF